MLGGNCNPCCQQEADCCAKLEGYGWSVTPASGSYGLCNQTQLNGTVYGYTNKPPSAGQELKTQNFLYFYLKWSDQQTLLVTPQTYTRFGIAKIQYNNNSLMMTITTCAGTAIYDLPGKESVLGSCPTTTIDFTPESLTSFTPSGNCNVSSVGGFRWSRYSGIKSAASSLSDSRQFHIKVKNAKLADLDGQPLTDLYPTASTPEATVYQDSDITLTSVGTECRLTPLADYYGRCPERINATSSVGLVTSGRCLAGPSVQQQPAFFWCQQNDTNEFNSGYAVGGQYGSNYTFPDFNVRYVMLFPPTADCTGFGGGAWRLSFFLPVAQINVYYSKLNPRSRDTHIPVFLSGSVYFQAGDFSQALADSTLTAFDLSNSSDDSSLPTLKQLLPLKIYETGDWSGDGPDEITYQYVRDLYRNYYFATKDVRATRKRIPDTDFDAYGYHGTTARVPICRIRTTITLEGIT